MLSRRRNISLRNGFFASLRMTGMRIGVGGFARSKVFKVVKVLKVFKVICGQSCTELYTNSLRSNSTFYIAHSPFLINK